MAQKLRVQQAQLAPDVDATEVAYPTRLMANTVEGKVDEEAYIHMEEDSRGEGNTVHETKA